MARHVDPRIRPEHHPDEAVPLLAGQLDQPVRRAVQVYLDLAWPADKRTGKLRNIRHLAVLFLRVVFVVESQADDLGRVCHRRT